MPARKVVEYVDEWNHSPFDKWFVKLNAQAAAKVSTALYRLEQGNLSNTRSVGKGVFEYKINFGPGYRIYFGQDEETLIILLIGGTKKQQNTDIKQAQELWAEYKRRKRQKWDIPMALTKDFKETIAARVKKDTRFRRALLTEAIESFLDGDVDTGKAILRDYINATIGFEELSRKLKKDSKSVHRMLGQNGNPRADNIFAIIKILQDAEHISLHVISGNNKAA